MEVDSDSPKDVVNSNAVGGLSCKRALHESTPVPNALKQTRISSDVYDEL